MRILIRHPKKGDCVVEAKTPTDAVYAAAGHWKQKGWEWMREGAMYLILDRRSGDAYQRFRAFEDPFRRREDAGRRSSSLDDGDYSPRSSSE